MCIQKERERDILHVDLLEGRGRKEGRFKDSEEPLSIIGKLLSSNLFCCPSHVNVM